MMRKLLESSRKDALLSIDRDLATIPLCQKGRLIRSVAPEIPDLKDTAAITIYRESDLTSFFSF
jgi:hypothetical protein